MAIGTVWALGTWAPNAWVTGSWADTAGGGSWVLFTRIGTTAVDEDGVMGTIFLDDASSVPGTAILVPHGIAHHENGRRYVALWPASNEVFYRGRVAFREDGAMIIDPAGVGTQSEAGTALTFRGEVLASESPPQLALFGFGHRTTGAMCMSNVD